MGQPVKIVNARLRAKFSAALVCELCRMPGRCECHHATQKGIGGQNQLDIPINLCSLGGAGSCNCHGRFHSTGDIEKAEILKAISRREGVEPDRIQEVIRQILHEYKAWNRETFSDLPFDRWENQ